MIKKEFKFNQDELHNLSWREISTRRMFVSLVNLGWIKNEGDIAKIIDFDPDVLSNMIEKQYHVLANPIEYSEEEWVATATILLGLKFLFPDRLKRRKVIQDLWLSDSDYLAREYRRKIAEASFK